jgi:hypothetical protein
LSARLAIEVKKAHPDWPLTVFLRNKGASVDEWFTTTAGADKIIHGDISDIKLLQSMSRDHDIVVNAISSFDGELIKNIITGMESRSGEKGTLIHISGTGNFIDGSQTGAFKSESKVWNVSPPPLRSPDFVSDNQSRIPAQRISNKSTGKCSMAQPTFRTCLVPYPSVFYLH